MKLKLYYICFTIIIRL